MRTELLPFVVLAFSFAFGEPLLKGTCVPLTLQLARSDAVVFVRTGVVDWDIQLPAGVSQADVESQIATLLAGLASKKCRDSLASFQCASAFPRSLPG